MLFTAAQGGAWERGWVLAAFLEPVLITGYIRKSHFMGNTQEGVGQAHMHCIPP